VNVPGNGSDAEEHGGSKWSTIRYAIGGWGTTVRLFIVLLAVSGPAYLIAWLVRR
jgi:hypothetical protein